jgi:glycosyltransferase involved in cell wall biosynthesis
MVLDAAYHVKQAMTGNYSIVTVVPGLNTSSGGPSFVVPSLVAAVARQGVRCSLLSATAQPGEDLQLPPAELVPTKLVAGGLGAGWRVAAEVARRVRQQQVDLLHVHGLWMPACFLASRVARQQGIPLVITPHGMLEPWAWRYHAWKKRPVWWLCEQRNVRAAAVLHATAQAEVAGLRQLGVTNPIAMIPNGVALPAETAHQRVAGDGCRTILFLSRIHPKKGLLHLVAAWQRARVAGWRVVVAGPDPDGHLAEVRQAAQQAGVAADFDFPGSVYGDDKWRLYREADLFILPTFSENFGVVVAEALGMGVPVITTKGAPWQSLEEERCGWWVDVGVDPLAEALRQAMALTDAQRQTMGARGAAMVRNRFSWERIGKEMATVYDWVLGRADRPECVRL